MGLAAMPRDWPRHLGFALLALVTPVMMGYVIYFQLSTPALDCALDGHTGRVLAVPEDSFADWAGLQPGDVVVSVDGVPFAEWQHPAVGNYPAEIRRGDRRLTLELPLVPLVRLNLLSLVMGVLVALIFWGTGAMLLWRRFRQEDVRIFFLLSQVFALAVLILLAFPVGVRPASLALLSIACFHLSAPMLLHHILTFPVPLGTPWQRRRVLVPVYALALVMVFGAFSWNSLWMRLSVLYTTLEIAAALGVLTYTYVHRATADGRRRLRLIVSGNLLAGVPPLFFYLVPSALGSSYRMPGWLMGPFLVVAPLSYLLAIARHNLFGIDRLLNRALVYALLSLGVLLLYLGPFVAIYRLLSGDPLLQTMIAVGLTILVGLSFSWMRSLVQRLVDRVFYGGWYDYPGVVETISGELVRTLERGQLADVLIRRVPELMQLHASRLEILDAADPTSLPDHSSAGLRFPLHFQGRIRGLWVVGPRRDDDDFSAEDLRILKTLVRQAEVALGNVLLVERLRRQLDEIRAVQQRLLRSREEERARLARDLHDGPVQALVALNLQLGLLRGTTEERSVTGEALRDMRSEVRGLLTELRQTCAELRPPMLDALGLGSALRALADEWFQQCGVAVRFDLSPDAALRSLPDEVSVNLYRVVQEALTNVARHAHARQVTLRLHRQDEGLTLVIEDDGQGFTVQTDPHELVSQGHFGLVGMKERMALIGGRLRIESEAGKGTKVFAEWYPGTGSGPQKSTPPR